MSAKKSYIPLKLLLSYIALAALVGVVAWFLYSENTLFTKNENKITIENQKILKVSQLLSNMYKAESFVRSTLQSESDKEFINYTQQIDTLKSEKRFESYRKNGIEVKYEFKNGNYFLNETSVFTL